MRTDPLLALIVAVAACGGTGSDTTPTDETGADEPGDTDLPEVAFDCDVDDSTTWEPDARMIRWPYFTNVTSDRATIQFGLTPGLEADVEWGTDDTFGATVAGEVEAHDELVKPIAYHAIPLEGLAPNTPYCFRVVLDGDDLTGPLAFRTAPLPTTTRTVRFLVMGDFGNGSEIAQGVYDQIQERYGDIDFWVTTGDNAYSDGTWQEWERNVFDFYRDLLRRAPFYPVPGNHDYRDGDLTPMLGSLALPEEPDAIERDKERYYAFDWGPIHFTMADSQWAVYDPEGVMETWMRDDLASDAAKDAPWRIASWHHPVHMTQPGRYADIGVKLVLQPLAEDLGVDLVLNGHNHAYERFFHLRGDEKLATGGTSYLLTGGGGASVYDILPDDRTDRLDVTLRDVGRAVNHFVLIEADRCTMTGTAIDTEGTEIDAWTLTNPDCPDM